jgi:beta-lactam-binding protein with PASTA domain/serine/threonine protein kinase
MTLMDTQFNGRVVAGRYQLGPRRGSGVDAAVFDAFDMVEQRVVAIKVVHPDLSSGEGFERAFRMAAEQGAAIKHPNIAEIYDWGADIWNDRKAMYVIVEHLSGGSLREYLDRGRTLSPSQALMVGLEACKALDVVHRNGLVHGDIRPSTLVFGDDGRLRITDVGLANVVGEALWTDRAHVSNALAMYAAPELAESGRRGPRGDVYSLCLTMLESMSGSVPFAGDSTVATLSNRIDKLMPVSADLGPLATVLERAGRPLPDDRYSAAEFGRALVQAAEKLPRPAPINLPNSGLFGDSSGAIARPTLPPPVPVAGPPEPPPPITTEYVPTNEEMTAPRARPVTTAPVEPDPPRRRRWIAWMVPLVLLLAAAAGGIAFLVTRDQTKTYQVPPLVGLTEAEALNQISGFDWQTVVTREASDTVASGVVIRTQPDEATLLDEKQPFQLVVSTGPAPRPLPDLVGLTLDQATASLQQLDLVLQQSDAVFDETIPAGIVISWMVPDQPGLKAGDTVTPKTTVSVVLSAGPQPRVVPNLAGLTVDAATAALTEQALVLLQLEPQFDNTGAVAAGLIISQDLAPDSTVDRGAVISVVVSKGQDFVAVPSLGNLTLQQVTDTLSAAGLAVGTVTGNTSGFVVAASYQGVDVQIGQTLLRGTAIDIALF